MAITKLALLRLMSHWPFVGKKIQHNLTQQLLEKLDKVEKSFGSPTIRFSTNIAVLYDSLEGFDFTLEENFTEYNRLALVAYTKTSGEAHKLLERLSGIGGPKVADYFKDTMKDAPSPFLDWYSNRHSFEAFIGGTISLLDLYTKMNPSSNDGHVYTAKELAVSYSTQEFLSSKYFKFLVLDLIQALRIVLYLEINGIHEKER
jgi:hypothetical protein